MTIVSQQNSYEFPRNQEVYSYVLDVLFTKS